MVNCPEHSWVVQTEESGVKLQVFLKNKLESFSARQIKHSVDSGNCQINGKVERFSSRLVGRGDRITFYQPVEVNQQIINKQDQFDLSERILYTDNELIIYNKPAGISSDDPRLLSFIKKQTNGASAQLVHRLDRNTTGVLIFATNQANAEAMFALFKQRQIKKTYLAIVDGVIDRSEGVVDNFLGKINAYHGQTLYGEVSRDKGGLRARTQWKRKKAGKDVTLVACYPETGRTHQLRVHLSGAGHPILGDYQYGSSFGSHYRPTRMMLHAAEIAFIHPVTKQPVHVIAKTPKDFSEAEMRLFKTRESL